MDIEAVSIEKRQLRRGVVGEAAVELLGTQRKETGNNPAPPMCNTGTNV